MILNKWAVALLQVVFVLFTALQTARADGVSQVEVWQLSALAVSSAAAAALPLLKGGWHSALKVLAALAGAFFAAVIPLVNVAWTFDSSIIVIVAVLNALMIQFGVDARIDGAKAVLSDPEKSNATIVNVDPVAAKIAAADIVTEAQAFAGHGR